MALSVPKSRQHGVPGGGAAAPTSSTRVDSPPTGAPPAGPLHTYTDGPSTGPDAEAMERFRQTAEAYRGGLELGRSSRLKADDFKAAHEALSSASRNQLLELGARMGPNYGSSTAIGTSELALRFIETAESRSELDRLQQTFSQVVAEVPAAEVPLPPRVAFPQLTVPAEVGALTEALLALDVEQLDFVVASTVALTEVHGLNDLSGARNLTAAVSDVVQYYESRSQLGVLADAVALAPARLQSPPRLSPDASFVDVIPHLHALDDASLRQVARDAGMNLEDTGGQSRLGVAQDLARSARARGHLDQLTAALMAR